MAAARLQYVGVFRNHDIADVVDKAKVLSLAAVQLHGNEEQLYIDTLKLFCQHMLPSGKH
ncbi:hypothetical protein ACLB1S_13475 [Escherichia coli]